jgi:hypothetical protein
VHSAELIIVKSGVIPLFSLAYCYIVVNIVAKIISTLFLSKRRTVPSSLSPLILIFASSRSHCFSNGGRVVYFFDISAYFLLLFDISLYAFIFHCRVR